MSNQVPEATVITDLLNRQGSDDNLTLFSLSDIQTSRAWDHSWPTLTKPRRFTERNTYVSDEPFWTVLKNHNLGVTYALLKAVGAVANPNPNHIVLHGGSLVDIVLKRESSIADWDFRLIGERFVEPGDGEQACVEAAKKFIKDIFAWLKQENERIAIDNAAHPDKGLEGLYKTEEVKISRVKSTITVIIPRRLTRNRGFVKPTTFQLTFQPYASVQELLKNTSPHCTRIAVKDDKVVLHELARYSLESVCLILTPGDMLHNYINDSEKSGSALPENARPLTTEMSRVIKYFEKGFDIILPDLDVTKMPSRLLKFDQTEVLDLPFLTILYDRLDGNKIMVEDIELPKEFNNDDGPAGYASSVTIDVGISIHHNIQCIIAGDLSRFHYVAEGEKNDHVFDFCPLLTSRMVGKAYEKVDETLSSGTIPIQMVVDYFGLGVSPKEVFSKLIIDPLVDDPEKKGSKVIEINKKVLAELIAKEKEHLIKKIQSLPSDMKEQGRDHLLTVFPAAVSTESEIHKALYGLYSRDIAT